MNFSGGNFNLKLKKCKINNKENEKERSKHNGGKKERT